MGSRGTGQETGETWARWEKAGLDDLLEGMTATEFLLRATISNPDAHTTIVGTLDPSHLRDNVAAALKGPLADDVLEEGQTPPSISGVSVAAVTGSGTI